MDFILNGQGYGDIASQLVANNMDARILRPWVGDDGRSYIAGDAVVNGQLQEVSKLYTNANATLRKDAWIQLDDAVLKAARQRLRFVDDIRSAGLTYSVKNGMGTTVLQTERMTEAGEATISMDGLAKTRGDRVEFDLTNLPLPIIHSEFSFSARQVAASKTSGTPIDTAQAEQAARRVAEKIESLALGKLATYTYGNGTLYGLTNFPERLTATITDPTSPGWEPRDFFLEIMAMKQDSMDNLHYGPWTLYTASAWDQYLDDDYLLTNGNDTLRSRIKKINGIDDVVTLDYLTGYECVLLQKTSNVFRMVEGMNFTTMMWKSSGGLELNYAVMAILVPQPRAEIEDRTGIVHGNV